MAGSWTGFYTIFSMIVTSLTERDCGNDASNMFTLSMDSGRKLIILISSQVVCGKPYLVTTLELQVDDFF